MLKEIMNRKNIDAEGIRIANGIIERFPIEVDKSYGGDSKAAKKAQKKLNLALTFGSNELRKSKRDLSLGVYGKARLYKAVQDRLLAEGYSSDSSRVIVEFFTKTL